MGRAGFRAKVAFFISLLAVLLLSQGLVPVMFGLIISDTYVQGTHVKYSFIDAATGAVPQIAINSTWASVTPVIDGKIDASEWQDSFYTNIFGAQQIDGLYVKNDASKLYMATVVPSDHTDNNDLMYVFIYPTPGTLNDGKQISFYLYSNGTALYIPAGSTWSTRLDANGRQWEIAIPISDLHVVDPSHRVNCEIGLIDGSRLQTASIQYPDAHWPLLSQRSED